MSDTKWTPKGFFPRLFIWLCILVNIAGIVALIILIVTEFIILVNNYQSYVARYGYHYRMSPPQFFLTIIIDVYSAKDGYLGDYGCGYVEFTNAPKVSLLQFASCIYPWWIASWFSHLDALCSSKSWLISLTLYWYIARPDHPLYNRHCLWPLLEKYEIQFIRIPICWWCVLSSLILYFAVLLRHT